MKEGFEETLQTYNDEIRALTADERELYGLVDDMGDLFVEESQRHGTSQAVQEKIFRFQEEKVAIMERLHEKLRALDDPASQSEEGSNVERVVSADHDTLVVQTKQGSVPVSRGEVLTDLEWGKEYHFDPVTVPRDLRKRYIVETAKLEIRALLDKQILENEAGVLIRRNPRRERNFFAELQDRDIEAQAGLIAEKMVRTFLKKMAIDYHFNFDLVEADIYQDTVEKIDFVIHRTQHLRGVRVDAAERTDIGIQFTTNPRKEVQAEKKQQIEWVRDRVKQGGIDDILLVTLPLDGVKKQFETWKKTEAPGGPDKLWSVKVKETIFRAVMKDILPAEEIEDAVEKIRAK